MSLASMLTKKVIYKRKLYVVIPFLYISKTYKSKNSVLLGNHTYVIELILKAREWLIQKSEPWFLLEADKPEGGIEKEIQVASIGLVII